MEAASESPAKSLTNPRGGGIAIWSRTAKTITAYCCTPTAQPSRRFLHGLARDLDPRCRRPHRAVPDSPGVTRTLGHGCRDSRLRLAHGVSVGRRRNDCDRARPRVSRRIHRSVAGLLLRQAIRGIHALRLGRPDRGNHRGDDRRAHRDHRQRHRRVSRVVRGRGPVRVHLLAPCRRCNSRRLGCPVGTRGGRRSEDRAWPRDRGHRCVRDAILNDMTRSAVMLTLLVAAAPQASPSQAPAGPPPVPTNHWSADPAHSAVAFRVRHLGITWVNGTFGQWTADLNYDPATPGATTSVLRSTSKPWNAQRPPEPKGSRGRVAPRAAHNGTGPAIPRPPHPPAERALVARRDCHGGDRRRQRGRPWRGYMDSGPPLVALGCARTWVPPRGPT